MSSNPAGPADTVVGPVDDRTGPVAAAAIALGTVLIVLAVPASRRLAATGLTQALATVAVGLAAAAVVAGLAVLLLAVSGKARPARLAVVSGVLVAAAVVAAGGAVAGLVGSGGRPAVVAGAQAGLTVRFTVTGEGALLAVHADLPDVAAGDLVRAEISVVADPTTDSLRLLAQEVTTARVDGTVSVDLAANSGAEPAPFRVLVESPDRRCTAALAPDDNQAPVLACKSR